MPLPPTFTIESRSHLSAPEGIYDFSAHMILPNDIVRWKRNGHTVVARVISIHKMVGYIHIYGYIKVWDKAGRKTSKGRQRSLITIPNTIMVDCIGQFTP